MTARIGIVGARGHAGGELLRLVAGREDMAVAYAASRAKAGEPLSALAPGVRSDLTIVAPDPDTAAAGLDALVLALPNGESAPYVAAIEAASPATALIDFSADHRFDDAWVYGLPELNGGRERIRGARRIANPGCYATATLLALGPLASRLSGPASAFGVSGYSGAGSTPNPRNDAARLEGSLMPYALTGHGHEGEIRRHAGAAVNFSPHVAGFFRGLSATVQAPLTEPLTREELKALFHDAFGGEPLIALHDEPPELREGRQIAGAVVGGFTAAPEERRAVVVAVIDNLLKGAASQALQNIALALGLDEFAGLPRCGATVV
ncbi:MAG: N-acetyl-gamma-glutamyl-phosphate reductase [Caulobacterales bacterium]|nr:N-acetyl-gamma-glutamyl-phosphate reductase [Caulobacterales bacterium]